MIHDHSPRTLLLPPFYAYIIQNHQKGAKENTNQYYRWQRKKRGRILVNHAKQGFAHEHFLGRNVYQNGTEHKYQLTIRS